MSALPVMSFRLWIDQGDGGEPAEHEVTIKNVDRIHAERSSIGQLPLGASITDLPMYMTTAWCWAAAKRLGFYQGPLTKFVEVDLLDYEPVDDDDDTPPPVDPTDRVTA